ncbi:hypothetical protein EJB05_02530 [Eragrostis curvula]|uniref:Uncharacterized protein n=1 Tax=Eragrostis curvula TaxID=38414 RepID=A0A5J9WSL9_9POAL|nr:hypothetical protein EJB05_02530 [Eragrostis curvula]
MPSLPGSPPLVGRPWQELPPDPTSAMRRQGSAERQGLWRGIEDKLYKRNCILEMPNSSLSADLVISRFCFYHWISAFVGILELVEAWRHQVIEHWTNRLACNSIDCMKYMIFAQAKGLG